MQIWSSGYDKFNIEDAHDRGILVANNHGSNAISVAEHTILMMLGVSRRAPEMHNRVTTGNWAGNDHGMTSYSLSGKTLGIVGLGNIGTLVAKRAEALGMKIAFADPGVTASPAPGWEKQTFEELLTRSDYVTFHVHLGPETKNMFNSTNIGLLKKKPFLINVSRAELIEREALLAALESQAIRGVAIDAHYQEPTEPSDKLFSFDTVFYSPHIAGSTVDSYQETVRACVENIRATHQNSTTQGLIRSAD
jgi:D-3-phosphoglycerate dehydrogenase